MNQTMTCLALKIIAPIAEFVMLNMVCVETLFAHMTFKMFGMARHSCRKQFSTRRILKAKLPEPGGGSTVEQSDYED